MKIEDINQLLDLAKAQVGSDYKLAQLMGQPRQRVSGWRNEQTTMSPEDVAIAANIAGLDPVTWAVRAMVAKHEGTAKGDRLVKALGKALLATGAAVASSGAHAMGIYSKTIEHFIRCIVVLSSGRHFSYK